MHLIRILGADLVEAIGRREVEQEVALAVLDLRDLGLDREAELLHDLVDEALRLRVGRPLLEMRVALKHELVVRVVLREHVRAGGGRQLRAEVLVRRAPREHRGVRHGELVEPLGIRRRQVERDGSGLVVDDDALGEIARRGRLEALVGPHEHAVEAAGRRRVHLEDALERPQEVARLHGLAVGVLDALAQLECPRLAAVRRLRECDGEIRHEREGLRSSGVLERDQPVLGRLVELPVLQRVVDLRVQRAAGALGEHDERAAAVLGHQLRARLRFGGRRGAGCLRDTGAGGCHRDGQRDQDREGEPVTVHRAPSARADGRSYGSRHRDGQVSADTPEMVKRMVSGRTLAPSELPAAGELRARLGRCRRR